ncbi:MAG: efflux RND transporter periplasmic adaptor subunit [Synechococcaceae cyanobacterium]|nr:efflux RND transporter periplasmic adaptor subunit [Synechococcaceae cyanobacterium]
MPQPAGSRPGLTCLILAVSLGLSACGAPASESRQPLPSVRMVQAQERPFPELVDTVSTLESTVEVQLAAQAGGRIDRLLIRQGDRVRRGQLLLLLDQTQARAEVARLRAEVATNRINFDRYNWLVRQGAASAFQRDEFRQRFVSSREELVARQADLAYRDLRAPVDGIVGDVLVKQGDVIQPGSQLSSIIRNDRLLARVEVPAVVADRLRLGQAVRLIDPRRDAPLLTTRIISIDPSVVSASQVVLAKAPVDNVSGALRDGQRLRARLELDSQSRPAVPFAAVTRIAGQSFVFTLSDRPPREASGASGSGRRGQKDADRNSGGQAPGETPGGAPRGLQRYAIQTPVRLGLLQQGQYPVLSGLSAGTEVIAGPLLGLRHGSPVRLRGAAAPTR